MKKILLILISFFSALVITLIVLASNKDIGMSVRAEEIKDGVEQWAEKITKIEISSSFQSSFPNPNSDPNAFFEVYDLGYAAAPYLVDYVLENNLNNFEGAFLVMAAATNLHLYSLPGSVDSSEGEDPAAYSQDQDAYTPVWYAKQLKAFAKTAPDKVTEICDSNISIDEKEKQLIKYGMLAVPTLQERINKGENQWAQCVGMLSLSGMDTQERFDVIALEYTQDFLNSGKRLDLVCQNRFDNTENFILNKKWFSSNKEDLSILKEMCK